MSEAIWRDDGVINFVVPSPSIADTFLVLAPAHSSWLCFLMEDMAAVLEDEDVKPEVKDAFHLELGAMKKGMQKGHKTAEHEPRMKRGTEDYLPGMIHGTMHPAELSALADDLDTILVVFTMNDNSDTGKAMIASWAMWLEAAKKYVRPWEAVAHAAVRTVQV